MTRTASRRCRVLIVSCDASFTDAIKSLLTPAHLVVGVLHIGDAAKTDVRRLAPDLILADAAAITNDAPRAGQQMVQIVEHFRTTPIVVCAPPLRQSAGESDFAGQTLRATEVTSELATDRLAMGEPLEQVLCLLPPLAQSPATSPPQLPAPPPSFSRRERDVLALLAGGHPMKQIAHRLAISYRTVAYHKYKLMRKLGVRTHSALLSYAIWNTARQSADQNRTWSEEGAAAELFGDIVGMPGKTDIWGVANEA